jgi:hypothetical protein
MPTAALPDLLTVLPWDEPDLVGPGHDPRSAYVEDYWLGILGPSGTWTMRRFAHAFDHDADGFLCNPAELASEIGLGRGTGANAPFTRTIARLAMFDLVRSAGDQLHVRRRVPELNRRQIAKLPEHLGRAHEHQRRSRDEPDHQRAEQVRARRLAAVLAELGESTELIESRLHGWRVSPPAAADAAGWARSRVAHPSYRASASDETEARSEPSESDAA